MGRTEGGVSRKSMFATVFHECGLSKTSGTPGVVLFWKLSSVNMSAARVS